MPESAAAFAGPVDQVVLVPGYNEGWRDTLPAAGLVGQLGTAFVVAGNGDSLEAEPARELERLFGLAEDQRAGPGQRIFIAGNTETSISPAVEDSLVGRGFEVERVGGPRHSDEFGNAATAALLAGALLDRQRQFGGATRTVLIARRDDYVDALGLSGVAALNNWPLLYVNTDTVPDETCDFLRNNSVDTVYIGGGTAAISQAVEDELRDGCGAERPDQPRRERGMRLGGGERAETSVRIAEFFFSGMDGPAQPEGYILASARNYPDALAGAPLANAFTAPTLVTDIREGIEPFLRDYVCAAPRPDGRSFVLGGEVAVSTPSEDAFRAAVRGDGCQGGGQPPGNGGGPPPSEGVQWGLDSVRQYDLGGDLLAEAQETYGGGGEDGKPLYHGRYLNGSGDPDTELLPEEAEYMNQQGIAVLVVDSHLAGIPDTQLMGSDAGDDAGDAAVDEARRVLRIPVGTAILGNIEFDAQVDSDFLIHYYQKLEAAGYTPGFYGSPINQGGNDFESAFCSDAAVGIVGGAVLWAARGDDRTLEADAPEAIAENAILECDNHPEAGTTVVQQYGLECPPADVDADGLCPDGFQRGFDTDVLEGSFAPRLWNGLPDGGS